MANLYRSRGDDCALSPDSRFRFRCHAGLPCFGQCCRQPTIILHPYDILRLKRHLGVSSSEFLIRYTHQIVDEVSGLPLLLLDLVPGADGGCPFLKAGEGCTVYPERPAACRLFPVTQGSAWTPRGVEDFYFLKQLEYCRGFDTEDGWTLASWQADQDLDPYQDLDQGWKAILLAAGREGRPRVDARQRDLFSLGVYDVDEFRQLLLRGRLPGEPAAGEQSAELRQSDDVALLKFAYQYLQKLFLLHA